MVFKCELHLAQSQYLVKDRQSIKLICDPTTDTMKLYETVWAVTDVKRFCFVMPDSIWLATHPKYRKIFLRMFELSTLFNTYLCDKHQLEETRFVIHSVLVQEFGWDQLMAAYNVAWMNWAILFHKYYFKPDILLYQAVAMIQATVRKDLACVKLASQNTVLQLKTFYPDVDFDEKIELMVQNYS